MTFTVVHLFAGSGGYPRELVEAAKRSISAEIEV